MSKYELIELRIDECLQTQQLDIHSLDLINDLLTETFDIVNPQIYNQLLDLRMKILKELCFSIPDHQYTTPLNRNTPSNNKRFHHKNLFSIKDLDIVESAFQLSNIFQTPITPIKTTTDDDDEETIKDRLALQDSLKQTIIYFSAEEIEKFYINEKVEITGLDGEYNLLVKQFFTDKFYEQYNLNPNQLKSALMYGVPGTGKSYLARIIALKSIPIYLNKNNEAIASNSGFLALSSSRIKSKWVGESSKNVAALFNLARNIIDQAKPNKMQFVIFLDEIDSLFGEDPSSTDILNEFLVQMEGLESDGGDGQLTSNEGIILVAATNYPRRLPPNLLSRFKIMVRLSVPYPPFSSWERKNYNLNREIIMGVRKTNFYTIPENGGKNPAALIDKFFNQYMIPVERPFDFYTTLKLLWNETTPGDSLPHNNNDQENSSSTLYLTQRGLRNAMTMLWSELIDESIKIFESAISSGGENRHQSWIRWSIKKGDNERIRYIPIVVVVGGLDRSLQFESILYYHNQMNKITPNQSTIRLGCSMKKTGTRDQYKIYCEHDDVKYDYFQEFVSLIQLKSRLSGVVLSNEMFFSFIRENSSLFTTMMDQSMVDGVWSMDENWVPLSVKMRKITTTAIQQEEEIEEILMPRIDFFETQEGTLCGCHALNNLVGYKMTTGSELQYICDELTNKMSVHYEYCKSGGWFDSAVLSCVLMKYDYFTYDVIDRQMLTVELLEKLRREDNFVGFLINEESHWYAIQNGEIIDNGYGYRKLDSQNLSGAEELHDEDLCALMKALINNIEGFYANLLIMLVFKDEPSNWVITHSVIDAYGKDIVSFAKQECKL